MLMKQLPSTRNQRTRGFKVKYVFQVFLLIAVAIWLLYQLKHSFHKHKDYHQTSAITLETPKLGRKVFHPKDLIHDDEQIKVRSGSGGDDEVEESEEVEDLIDEEDKEREEEINEDEESEDMGKQIEEISSVKDKRHEESKEKSEKSRVMMRQTQSIGSEFQFGGLEQLEKTDSRAYKVVETVGIKHGSFQNVVLDFSDSEAASNSNSLHQVIDSE